MSSRSSGPANRPVAIALCLMGSRLCDGNRLHRHCRRSPLQDGPLRGQQRLKRLRNRTQHGKSRQSRRIFSFENYCGPAPDPAGNNAFLRIGDAIGRQRRPKRLREHLVDRAGLSGDSRSRRLYANAQRLQRWLARTLLGRRLQRWRAPQHPHTGSGPRERRDHPGSDLCLRPSSVARRRLRLLPAFCL